MKNKEKLKYNFFKIIPLYRFVFYNCFLLCFVQVCHFCNTECSTGPPGGGSKILKVKLFLNKSPFFLKKRFYGVNLNWSHHYGVSQSFLAQKSCDDQKKSLLLIKSIIFTFVLNLRCRL